MERSEATFGLRVVGADRLERHVDHSRKREPADPYGRPNGDWKGWVYAGKRWAGVNKPKPVEGILIGIRHVHESGWRVWMGDDGISWEPEGEKRAMALVATNLQNDPVRVWLSDLVVAGISAESRVSKALSYLESEAYYDAKPHKAHRDLESVRRVLSS